MGIDWMLTPKLSNFDFQGFKQSKLELKIFLISNLIQVVRDVIVTQFFGARARRAAAAAAAAATTTTTSLRHPPRWRG